MIHLDECHDSCIENIFCTHSKHSAVIRLYNTENVIIQNCTFEHVLNSAIRIVDSCNNTTVRNCTIKYSRYAYNNYYCYAVYTGIQNMDTAIGTVPPDNLIYENNYVYDTEDSGLDTHGATNVIIRNNKILQTVCAITAYNDGSRVNRPSGWRMRNVLIENNYCESNKANDASTGFPHPFIFVGSTNDATTDDDTSSKSGKANYDDFINCVLRNNYIKSPNDVRIITLSTVATNVKIENNYIYQDGSSTNSVIYGVHTIGLRILNNTFRRNNSSYCTYSLHHGYAEISGNTGLLVNDPSFSQLNRIYGEDVHMRLSVRCGTVMRVGDIINNGSGTKLYSPVNFIGSRIDTSRYTNTDKLNLTVDVIDNICYMKNGELNYLLPDLGIKMTNNSTSQVINAYVVTLLSFDSFKVYPNSLTDGEYTISLNSVVYNTITSIYVPGVTNRQVNLRSTPETPGQGQPDNTIVSVPSDTNVFVNQTKQGNYNFATVILNGITYHGYLYTNYVNLILDPVS